LNPPGNSGHLGPFPTFEQNNADSRRMALKNIAQKF
jgi:hypothetical protein